MTTETATTGRATRSSTRRVVMALVAVVLVVAVAFAVRWWTHPSVFGDLGDGFSSSPAPVARAAISTTVLLPQVEGESEAIVVDAARAVFSGNSAQAEATFSICHMRAGEDVIGSVRAPARFCADIEPLEAGVTYEHGVAPDTDYLVVTLTPTEPGVAHLVAVEVDYARGASHLFQRGTESIAVDRTITAT